MSKFMRSISPSCKVSELEAPKTYTLEQIKRVVVEFHSYCPQNSSIHTESVFDAWFEKYGDKVANDE